MEWSVCSATLVFATILLSPVEGYLGRPTLRPNVTGHLIPKELSHNQILRPNATGHLIPKELSRNDCLPSTEYIQVIPAGETVCIESPGYPQGYPANAVSIWMLDNQDQSGTMSVSCHPFKVRGSRRCKDYLLIQYPNFTDKYCGRKRPDNFETQSYWLDLTFVSDWKKNSKGFRCLVTAVAGDASSSTTTPGPAPPPGPTPPPGPNPSCECGLANIDRIVGGVPASPNEYPWLVGISSINNGNQPFCGGSVYNNEWIITAAHCISGTSPSSIKVVLGMYNYNNNSPTPTSRSVSHIIAHEHYNGNTVDNDIALLRLSSPVTFSSSIRPVCLPSSSADYAGQMATVTGWGTLSSGGSQPNMNYEVQMPIRTTQECRNSYDQGEITSNMICAGSDSFNKDSCQGDSGGPLTVPVNGHHYLAGIVSWGYGCAKPPYYGVYTKVPNYISWIQSKAGTTCTP